MVQLERDALACTGIEGRCRTTALIIAYGVQGTPKARLIRETLRSWFEILRLAPTRTIDDIRSAWPKARNTLMSAPSPISSVKGVMSNVIYILLQAGWDPVSFTLWVEVNGSELVIAGDRISANAVAAAVTRSTLLLDLKSASSHYDGFELQDGVDYHNSMSVSRGLPSTSVL